MINRISPTTHEIADLLLSLGWKNSNDAQFTELDRAVMDGSLVRAIFSAEHELRSFIDAEGRSDG